MNSQTAIPTQRAKPLFDFQIGENLYEEISEKKLTALCRTALRKMADMVRTKTLHETFRFGKWICKLTRKSGNLLESVVGYTFDFQVSGRNILASIGEALVRTPSLIKKSRWLPLSSALEAEVVLVA